MATLAPPNDIPSHAAMLMRWHGLGPEWIPETVTALAAWDLPELEITGLSLQAAYMSLPDVTAASCAAILRASS